MFFLALACSAASSAPQTEPAGNGSWLAATVAAAARSHSRRLNDFDLGSRGSIRLDS